MAEDLTSAKVLRVGFIGCGEISRAQAGAVTEAENARLTYAMDVNLDAAKALIEKADAGLETPKGDEGPDATGSAARAAELARLVEKREDELHTLELELATRHAHMISDDPNAYRGTDEFKALASWIRIGDRDVSSEHKQLLRTDQEHQSHIGWQEGD